MDGDNYMKRLLSLISIIILFLGGSTMPYQETTWVNGVTPVSAANLNNMEGGIKNNDTALQALTTQVNTHAKSVLITLNDAYSGEQGLTSGEYSGINWVSAEYGGSASSALLNTDSWSIVIPEGYSAISISATVEFEANSTGARTVRINRLRDGVIKAVGRSSSQNQGTYQVKVCVSANCPVQSGDEFYIEVFQNSGTMLTIKTGLISAILI